MIQFTTPWILWGALAASLPLLIHLFGRRRTQQVAFSSLRFLRKLERDQIRRLKLRQILLLILRTLLILLLMLAFSGPRYAPSESGGVAHETAVLLFDNTVSTSAQQNGRSGLEKMKNYARELVQSQDYVQTVVWTSVQSPEETHITGGGEIPENFLTALEPEYGKSEMGRRLTELRTWLDQQRIGNVDLFLFTDGQRAQYSGLSELSFGDWGESRFYPVTLSGALQQAGIREVRSETDLIQPGGTLPLEVQVERSDSTGPVATAVRVMRDGSKIGQTLLDWQGKMTHTQQFNVPLQEAGFVRMEVSLEEDAYSADDHWFTNTHVPGNLQIMLVTNSPDARVFAETALSSVAQTQEGFTFRTASTGELNGTALETIDLVIFSNVLLNDQQKRQLVEAVKGGTGVMFFPGSALRKQDSYRLTPESPVYGRYIALEEGQFQEVAQVDWNHPVLRGISTKDPSALRLPRMFRYFSMSDTSAVPLMRFTGGEPCLLETNYGNGRIWSWASGLSLEWSDLPQRGILIPMLVRGAYYLSGRQQQYRNQLTTGEPIRYQVGSDIRADQLRLITPEGTSVILPLRQGEVQFDETDTPGHYGIYHEEKLLALYSVNVQDTERDMDRLSGQEWRIIFGERFGDHIQTDSEETKTASTGLVRGIPLWSWLFGLALLCIFAEMIIAKTGASRQRSETE